MKTIVTFLVTLAFTICSLSAQEKTMKYEASKKHPFGQYNPEAPKQLQDYKELIGIAKCESVNRKPDQSWAKPIKMTWKWKYIMNGKAVQDETLKEDGGHSGSIRQFSKDSLRWNVHYYSSRGVSSTLPVWNGNKSKDGKIVLYRKQNAPNGTEGFYRLTFYDISKEGYKWVGEWVDTTEKIVFPTWKISCIKED
ncbi:hypothetical protein RQM59_06990 [Flavobacteriaceae bacterium S356]|uniref:Uncharacterized protein n=1 Tax=Asprobacillus argus TaxID=3076534 RepID=A0ABU3LEH8_9FLAO|nr:hypothetical protein [Flavobacteriaceae bacterium S356]